MKRFNITSLLDQQLYQTQHRQNGMIKSGSFEIFHRQQNYRLLFMIKTTKNQRMTMLVNLKS